MATATGDYSQFQVGDIVFAKIVGYRTWPAKVKRCLPDEQLMVWFYGTHDTATVPFNKVTPYTDNTKILLGKPGSGLAEDDFKLAMEEVQADETDYYSESESETDTGDEPPSELLHHELVTRNEVKKNGCESKKKIPSLGFDLNRIPEYQARGIPDLIATFRFPLQKSESASVEKIVTAKLHICVLEKSSPVFKKIITEGRPGFFQHTVIHGAYEDFEDFLTYLYTQEIGPDNLVQIFDFLFEFQVSWPGFQDSFKKALSCRNTMKLLERLPMKRNPSKTFYRSFSNVNADYGEMLRSALFYQLSRTTLEELAPMIINNADRDTFLENLYEWGRAEFCRFGAAKDIPNGIPHTIPDTVGDTILRSLKGILELGGARNEMSSPKKTRKRKAAGPSPEAEAGGKRMKVFIEGVEGSVKTFEIATNASTEKLHRLISKELGLPIVNIQMMHDGVKLESQSATPLGFYNVQNGSRIWIKLTHK